MTFIVFSSQSQTSTTQHKTDFVPYPSNVKDGLLSQIAISDVNFSESDISDRIIEETQKNMHGKQMSCATWAQYQNLDDLEKKKSIPMYGNGR